MERTFLHTFDGPRRAQLSWMPFWGNQKMLGYYS